jgi:hypothetical protein
MLLLIVASLVGLTTFETSLRLAKAKGWAGETALIPAGFSGIALLVANRFLGGPLALLIFYSAFFCVLLLLHAMGRAELRRYGIFLKFGFRNANKVFQGALFERRTREQSIDLARAASAAPTNLYSGDPPPDYQS